MPRACFTVHLPATTWIAELSTAHPGTTFRVVTALAGEDAGHALLELDCERPLPVVSEMVVHDAVDDVELLWKQGAEAVLQVETAAPPLLRPAWEAGVPIELPFVVRDGEATWTVTTTNERLSAFGDRLAVAGIDFDVEYVHDVGTSPFDRLLTDRQREVLLAAVDAGYYETPRETTLTDLAASLGVAKATASDVLHRAEGNVLSWFVGEHATPPGDSTTAHATE